MVFFRILQLLKYSDIIIHRQCQAGIHLIVHRGHDVFIVYYLDNAYASFLQHTISFLAPKMSASNFHNKSEMQMGIRSDYSRPSLTSY